ncbi:hypothetical protein LTR85_005309 [Meristemomyces frigidus]|nr:hypothetical protein LTR85_005309 [Meristemomyces frigidus]
MDRSLLGRLPPELFQSLNGPYLRCGIQRDGPGSAQASTRHDFALSRACKQIHYECGQSAFHFNTFEVGLRQPCLPSRTTVAYKDEVVRVKEEVLRPLRLFIDAIGENNAAALRRLKVDFGLLCLYDLEDTVLPAVVGGVLHELGKMASSNRRWDLHARFGFKTYRVLLYAINMDQAATSLGAIADDLVKMAATQLLSFDAGQWRVCAGYLAEWEQAAAVW